MGRVGWIGGASPPYIHVHIQQMDRCLGFAPRLPYGSSSGYYGGGMMTPTSSSLLLQKAENGRIVFEGRNYTKCVPPLGVLSVYVCMCVYIICMT